MDFWDVVEVQLKELACAKTAADVVRILGGKEAASSGDAFFAGSGGDEDMLSRLTYSGWSVVRFNAHYYWMAEAPNGDRIEYIEGDVYVRKGEK